MATANAAHTSLDKAQHRTSVAVVIARIGPYVDITAVARASHYFVLVSDSSAY